MILFKEFKLENGLQVIHFQDNKSPLVHINLLYNVGSRDENPNKTGLAHLLEHLMFSGSKHVSHFEEHVHQAGGTYNAFTNTDITNYYITVPSSNIETALWLESNRMLDLTLQPSAVETEKKIVIEEFKQRYLNQPYGDVTFKLRELMYKEHPYRWPTIGKSEQQIQQIEIEDLEDFRKRFYHPSNAILSVSGNVDVSNTKYLVNRYFSEIPSGMANKNWYTEEKGNKQPQYVEIERDVPQDMLIIAYHAPKRNDKMFYSASLVADILGKTKASFLYHRLVHELQLFTEMSVYLTGEMSAGGFIIQGKINPVHQFPYSFIENEISRSLHYLSQKRSILESQMTMFKNKAQTAYYFSQTKLSNIGFRLCYYSRLGNTDLINLEPGYIKLLKFKELQQYILEELDTDKRFVLYVKGKQSHA
jgi:zinc protease